MKIIFYVLTILTLTTSNAQKAGPRLIVRGDDMGFTHSGNMAIMQSATNGIETSIEVIVPSPWFMEAVEMLKSYDKVDIGIHLALTSEWENMKWRPLTNGSTIRDENGYFLPMAFPNKNYKGRSLVEKHFALADVEKEFRAQIEMAMKYIPRISHISAHMGCTFISNDVKKLTQKLAREYNIGAPEIDKNSILSIGYDGPHNSSAEKITTFVKMIDDLEDGKTYLFIDHPGIDNEELRAIHHIGYENVAEDRQGVTDIFTSEEVKLAIARNNVVLIGYKDAVVK